MAGPISGGGGAAKLALQQLQQMQQTQQPPKPSVDPSGGGSNFANKMQTQELQQSQKVNEAQKVNQSIRPEKVRPTDTQSQTQKVQGTQKGEAARFGKTNTNSGMGSGIAKFMKSVNDRKSGLDNMMKKALSGKTFNNKELLVLQYRVSQFSMEMDLTSKVVDKTTGGIKQAMNTQV